ncbi:MAG: putative bifunctional diguanylate cyclase/phosphodiesterase [Desulfuromonas sp.]
MTKAPSSGQAKSLSIFLIEDDTAHAELIRRAFQEQSPRVQLYQATSLAGYHALLKQHSPDLVLMDINLPDGRALQALADSHDHRAFPLLVMTAYGNEELAVEALKGGAFDYLVKSPDLFRRLPVIAQGALREWQLLQQRRQAQADLQASERHYHSLFESIDEGFCVMEVEFDDDGTVSDLRLREINRIFSAQTGLGPDCLSRSIRELLPEIDPFWLQTYGAVARTGEAIRFQRPEQQLGRFFDVYAFRPDNGSRNQVAALYRDITEQKRYEEQLKHLATHDVLTGLANRTLLLDRLEQAIHYAHRSGRLVAALLFDLDRFKVINDSLGHNFGDQLLRAVAGRLQHCVRETDSVARLGGDEFVVILAEVADMKDIALVAGHLLEQLNRPYRVEDREIRLSASLGISLFPRDSDDSATLLRNADMAMYRAKRLERSSFLFYAPEMNQRLQETMELEEALRQALEQEQFLLHYQPKVNLATGQICGCEALVRWQHAQRGLISPAQFIPLAEETGLIVPLGDWVLRQACAQTCQWRNAGLQPVPVAVNLSARQFRKGDLTQRLQSILQHSGLAAGELELELTESMIMDNPQQAVQIMHELKQLGLSLSLDDFGTGYSSLNYLRRFPVDNLKIDRSFIRDVATDTSGASVVTSIIQIAHNLGLGAVAEGVETRDQLDFLRRCGCDQLQGYLFSKPLAAEDFAAFLREGRSLTPPI